LKHRNPQAYRAAAALFSAVPDFDEVSLRLTDPTWCLREDDYEPALEHELESRFTVANGFIGVRGSLDLPTEASRPQTFVAGLFDLRPGPPALSARVPAPQAFAIGLLVDGERLDIGRGSVRQHVRLLDYRSGILRSIWRHELPSGRGVSLESLRFACLANPNLAVQQLRLEFEGPADVTIRQVGLGKDVLQPGNLPSLWSTNDGLLAIACFQEVRLQIDRQDPSRWLGPASLESTVRCHRGLSLLQLTSYGLSNSAESAANQAQEALRKGKRSGLGGLHNRHVAHWQKRWETSDVAVEGDAEAQQALRLAVYHLNSAVDPMISTSSIGARGLTGDGYMGHVFWDTEMFMLPFYTLTWPEAARSLLRYRHQTLAAARAKAHRLGFRGALYAWESTDTGEEATPPYAIGPRGEVIAIRSGDLEHHVSAAVAYAVWQYWQATHDVDFLLRYGAEILLETARFWASRCRLEEDGLYHIRNVIGPDEYHEGVDDNAYNNCLAAWNIERGLETADLLARRWPERWQDLAGELRLNAAELERWHSTATAMRIPRDPRTALLEQFAGYFGLEQVDLSDFAARTAPMDVLLGAERTRRSQVIKQADVTMLLALLPEVFTPESRKHNFEYYESRCGHGSSLSPPIHAWVAARLGLMELAMRYFRETAAIDLNDSMGNSASGLHMAALGGLWQATVFGFGGLTLRADGLSFEPHLPEGWNRLCFPVQWRRRRLTVELSRTRQALEVKLEHGSPMTIYAGGAAHRLAQGKPVVAPLLFGQEVRG